MRRLSWVVVIGALAVVAARSRLGLRWRPRAATAITLMPASRAGTKTGSRPRPAIRSRTRATAPATEPRAWRPRNWPSTFPTRPTSAPPPNQGSFCWGNLLADGLAPGAQWEVENQVTHAVLASGNATSSGTVPRDEALNLPCTVFLVQLSSTTSGNVPITEPNLEAPC